MHRSRGCLVADYRGLTMPQKNREPFGRRLARLRQAKGFTQGELAERIGVSQRVLTEHEGNISATARALGMHRRTLQRKLQKRPVRR